MAAKKRSLRDKRKNFTIDSFVGRNAQSDLFANNLKLGVDHDEFKNVFNIYGQGGVGKTTLVKHYLEMATQHNMVITYLDLEDRKIFPVPAALARMARGFNEGEKLFKKFLKRYQDYLEKKSQLQLGMEGSIGMAGRITSEGLKIGIGAVSEFIPGAGFARELLPIDSLADETGRLVNIAWGKLGNNSDVELVLHPLEQLTPLWLEGLDALADEQNFCLVFDNYEIANPELDKWLCDFLNGGYGDVPYNILVIVSGREKLDYVKWTEFSDIMVSIPLEPFSVEEATSYLQRQGVTEEEQIATILEVSGRLPIFLSLLVDSDIQKSGGSFSYPTDRVVAHFLRHIVNPVLRQLARLAALARQLDLDVVKRLLPEDQDAHAGFNWLKTRPFVQKRAGHWIYHPVVRQQMMSLIREESEESWRIYHMKLAEYYAEKAENLGFENPDDAYLSPVWVEYRLEAHYHLLCANYHKHIREFLEEFLWGHYASPDSRERLQIWGEALVEAESDLRINDWKECISEGLYNSINGEGDYGRVFYQRLIDSDYFQEDKELHSFLYRLLAFAQYKCEDSEGYFESTRQSIAIFPTNIGYNNLAIFYREEGDLDKAEEFFKKAIELGGRTNELPLRNLAELYYFDKSDYEKSIEAYEKLVLEEDSSTYDQINFCAAKFLSGKHEEAIKKIKEVIEKEPDNAETHSTLADFYILKSDPESALLHVENTIKCDPENCKGWYQMGEYHRLKEETEKAIHFYEEALKINPNLLDAWNKISSLKFLNEDFEGSLAAIDEMIKNDNNKAITANEISKRLSLHQQFNKAEKWSRKAVDLAPRNNDYKVVLGLILYYTKAYQEALELTEDVLTRVPDHIACLNQAEKASLALNKIDKALEYNKRKILISPETGWDFYFRGCCYYSKNDGELAKENLLGAKKLGFESGDLYNKLGVIFFYEQNYDQAIEYYRKSIELQPSDFAPYCNLGRLYVNLKKFDKAKILIDQAIKLAPQKQGPRLELSWLLSESEEYEQLLKLGENIIVDESSASEVILTYLNLIKAATKLEKIDLAIKYIDRVIELNNDSYSYLQSIGFSYLRLHRFEEAETYFLKSIATGKKEVTMENINLGLIAYLRKDYEKSVEYWIKAFQSFEDHDKLLKGIEDGYKELKLEFLKVDRDHYWQTIERSRKEAN
jgi:tetratricopeptide (TPR) repeat protein